jgi:hypothetical protein
MLSAGIRPSSSSDDSAAKAEPPIQTIPANTNKTTFFKDRELNIFHSPKIKVG